MNVEVEKELRHLAKAETTIAQRDRKIAALQAEQDQARREIEADKERLALTILRQRGVLGVPAVQIATLLSNLDMSATAVHGAIIASVPPLQDEASDRQKLPSAP
jgi:septal ring factor EnvC (AmiA/AmiB activator)